MPTENWWFWFERNPSQHFIAAIRRVFPDFEPVDAGWDKLGMAIQLRACKTVDEVRSMQPYDVELFLDLYWPPAVAAATAPADDTTANPVGRPPQDDNELEARLFASWTAYRDDPNIVDKDDKDVWLETLPEVRGQEDQEKKRAIKARYLRLLRNTMERHRRKAAALKAQAPRTK